MTKAINDCTTEDELVEVYVNWCMKHGYQSMSADELHYELIGMEPRREKHIKWLEAYIKRWELVVDQVVEPAKTTIEVASHWERELVKLRCWITGFKAARGHDFPNSIPGEDVLRQIQNAIEEKEGQVSKTKRIRRSQMRACARAFKFQCLSALNGAVADYLRRHPEITLKVLAARLDLSKKALIRKLSCADTLSIRDIGEIAGVIDAEVVLTILPIEEPDSSHPTSATECETI